MKRPVMLFALMVAFIIEASITASAQETMFQGKACSTPIKTETMIVRLAEIEVYPEHLEKYLKYANEVDRLSVEHEPGVVCLFPMRSSEDSTQIRILEIYASEKAYQDHLKTEHFQKYKQGTLHMVKSLKLPTMQPLDLEAMQLIFKKK